WRRNGTNIGGANSATYTITGVDAGDAGSYDVVVTNTCGSVTSNIAVLTVGPALGAAGHDTNPVTACANYNPPALVINSPAPSGGTPPYTYLWQVNGSPVAAGEGGTSSTTATYDPGNRPVGVYNYNVVVSDACGN